MDKKDHHRKGNGMVGVIIIGAIMWAIFAAFGGDSEGNSSYSSGSTYSSYGYDREDPEYYEEAENPYSDGSGHSAGYEWAEENDVDSCGGNSNSFIEGCEEYLEQKEYEEYGEDAYGYDY